jgi:hypothetical protein
MWPEIMFSMLHIWIAAHHSLLVSNFADFLLFFFFKLGVLLYTPCVLGLCLFINDMQLLNNKKLMLIM